MRVIEKATREQLKTLPAAVQASALARVAIELASRLDGDPADQAAVLLARELRMVMGALVDSSKGGVDDVERFLARVATPAFGDR